MPPNTRRRGHVHNIKKAPRRDGLSENITAQLMSAGRPRFDGCPPVSHTYSSLFKLSISSSFIYFAHIEYRQFRPFHLHSVHRPVFPVVTRVVLTCLVNRVFRRAFTATIDASSFPSEQRRSHPPQHRCPRRLYLTDGLTTEHLKVTKR